LEPCSPALYLPQSLVEEWIREDIPFADLTTTVLAISDMDARARVILRERAVVCGAYEAAAVYNATGARVRERHIEGVWAEPGETILTAYGTAASLHAAWRVAQTLVAIGSAVATYTRLMVERAKQVNPHIVVAVARKAPPGLRHLYYHCVLCGGASLHRVGISDSILVFPNHYKLIGGLREALRRLRHAKSLVGERLIVVEVETLEEAIEAAESGVVDEVQVDHVTPGELAEIVKAVRKVNPRVKIAVGGGINLDNIGEYAATGVDVIVTSAPYWVKPVDVTTRIEHI